MIFMVLGTSGSGKTTVVREFMKTRCWKEHYIKGRKQPLYYSSGDTAVLGHYNEDCGGFDSIQAKGWEWIRKFMEGIVEEYGVIILEGLLLSEDAKQKLSWPASLVSCLRLLYLTTSIGVCRYQTWKRRGSDPGEWPVLLRTERPRRCGPCGEEFIIPTWDSKVNWAERLTRRACFITYARVRLEAEGVLCTSVGSNQALRILVTGKYPSHRFELIPLLESRASRDPNYLGLFWRKIVRKAHRA